MRRILATLGIGLMGLVASFPAWAGGSPVNNYTPAGIVSGLGTFLGNYESSFNQAGIAMAGLAVPYGFVMLKAFLVIAIMIYGIQMMFDVGGRTLEPSSFFMTMFWWATVFTIFTNYNWIATHVIGIMTELGQGLIGGGPFPNAAGLQTMALGFHIFTSAAGVISSTHGHWTWNLVHDLAELGSLYGSSFNFFVSLIPLTVVAGLIMAAGLVYTIFTFKFAFYLALALGLGPLFLPTLMFKWTRESFFDGWYQFTWTALMYKLAGPAVLSLAASFFIQPLNTVTQNNSVYSISASTGWVVVNWGHVFTSLVLSVLALWFMIGIDRIISTLAAGAAMPDGLGGYAQKLAVKSMTGGMG
ncbi:type IV secretion system protein [Acidihalobacter ferrooxydans]|uniref:Uncharacterized protein n=1 Tax=Acidihalobacter ferrooxydans TaxID=1765967 RepID=A0A1P8UFD2_9GAMM|nr:type IV secretion system protein [Acidihalobacter ferrooxydans]APZ42545.1 hypothetical protein BW247_05095 [Acidihalobacter ferrooxydans]